MSSRKNDLALVADLSGDLVREISHDRAGLRDRKEHLCRVSELFDQFIIPVIGVGIYELRRCSVRVLLLLNACQQEVEIIGKHQHCLCGSQNFRLLCLDSHELINCIEDLLLNAGAGIELCLRDNFIYFLVHAGRAAVAVAVGPAAGHIVLVEKHIVDSPCVDAHADRNFAQLFSLFETVLDLREEAVGVPVTVTVNDVHSVLETVDFFQDHLSVFHM